jgi:ParB-like chromosome segregation protein Spo0J
MAAGADETAEPAQEAGAGMKRRTLDDWENERGTIGLNRGRDTTKIHPVAEVFPEMSPAELQELADDIKANGLAHPVTRDRDGVILDGRNRLKACEIAGIESRFTVFEGDDPVAFIISTNLKRRHLNESQRAMVAAKRRTSRTVATAGWIKRKICRLKLSSRLLPPRCST